MEKKILTCECHSDEHIYIIGFDEEEKTVYISPHLITYRSIFKRFIVAIKYICGYKCKYGNFDEISISKENYKPLKDIVDFLEEPKYNKEYMIEVIENRIKTEYKKYSRLDNMEWVKITAHKIYGELFPIS